MQFWTVVRLGAGNGGLVIAGSQPTPMLLALCMAVPEGQTPEKVACEAGMWPYCYIRPAMSEEIDVLLTVHPELANTGVPEPFLRS